MFSLTNWLEARELLIQFGGEGGAVFRGGERTKKGVESADFLKIMVGWLSED